MPILIRRGRPRQGPWELITERRISRPYGLGGGEPGRTGENWLLRGGDEDRAEALPPACSVELHAGDVVRVLTPGGGGWGEAAPASGAGDPSSL